MPNEGRRREIKGILRKEVGTREHERKRRRGKEKHREEKKGEGKTRRI
jgi:hypothetical protein